MIYRRICLLLCIFNFIILASGCHDFPRDPGKTLEKVKDGRLIVGYSENPPWVIKTDTVPDGIEADLIKAFAKKQQASIIWQNDTEQDLFEMLEQKKLHVVIGGFTDKTPWKNKIGITRPYFTKKKEKHIMAVINGENAFITSLETFLHEQQSQLNRLQP